MSVFAPWQFEGQSDIPKGKLEDYYTTRMEINADLMGKFAESKWYFDVLPGGSQHFDWHAFPVNIPSGNSQWMVDAWDIITLKKTPRFVDAHISTIVYWLNACGFSVIECRFVAPGRLGDRRDLAGIPRVAKFIHSLNLFAQISNLEFGISTAANDAYRALEQVVAVFISELGYYGEYMPHPPKLSDKIRIIGRYILPGKFIRDAGFEVGVGDYERSAKDGRQIPVKVENPVENARAIIPFLKGGEKIYQPDSQESLPTGPPRKFPFVDEDQPLSPTSAPKSVEEEWDNVTFGLILLGALIGCYLAWEFAKELRTYA